MPVVADLGLQGRYRPRTAARDQSPRPHRTMAEARIGHLNSEQVKAFSTRMPTAWNVCMSAPSITPKTPHIGVPRAFNVAHIHLT